MLHANKQMKSFGAFYIKVPNASECQIVVEVAKVEEKAEGEVIGLSKNDKAYMNQAYLQLS